MQRKVEIVDIDSNMFHTLLGLLGIEMQELSKDMGRSNAYIYQKIKYKSIKIKQIYDLRDFVGQERFDTSLEKLYLHQLLGNYYKTYSNRSRYMLLRNLIEQNDLIFVQKDYIEELESHITTFEETGKKSKFKKKIIKYPDLITGYDKNTDMVTLEDNYPTFESMVSRINYLSDLEFVDLLQDVVKSNSLNEIKLMIRDGNFNDFADLVTTHINEIVKRYDNANNEIKSSESEVTAETEKILNKDLETESKNQNDLFSEYSNPLFETGKNQIQEDNIRF